jgi:hypothetical protein
MFVSKNIVQTWMREDVHTYSAHSRKWSTRSFVARPSNNALVREKCLGLLLDFPLGDLFLASFTILLSVILAVFLFSSFFSSSNPLICIIYLTCFSNTFTPCSLNVWLVIFINILTVSNILQDIFVSSLVSAVRVNNDLTSLL